MLRIIKPVDSTTEVHCVCHYNFERYRDADRWQAAALCISTDVCA